MAILSSLDGTSGLEKAQIVGKIAVTAGLFDHNNKIADQFQGWIPGYCQEIQDLID